MRISPRHAYLAAFIGVCGHASSEFVAKLSGVAGPEASVWRYVLGGGGLVLWALLTPGSRDVLKPVREEGLSFILLSLIGVSLTYLAFHWALDYATVIQVATIVTTIPIFVGLTNTVVNQQPLSTVKIVVGLMAMIGVMIILTDGYLERLRGEEGALFGVLLALACAFFGSVYAVLLRPVVGRHGALTVTASSLAIGAVGLWLSVGAFWSVWVNPFTLFDRPAKEAWSLLALGLWNTTITQLLWFGGLAAAADITRASYLFFLKPVIAAGLAVWLLSESLSALQAAAILVVTGSVFVEMFWPTSKPS